jgi:hypothetical protein
MGVRNCVCVCVCFVSSTSEKYIGREGGREGLPLLESQGSDAA